MAPAPPNDRMKKQKIFAFRMIPCFILAGFFAFNAYAGTYQPLPIEDTTVDEKSKKNCFNQENANGARCNDQTLNVEFVDASLQPYPNEFEIEVKKNCTI